MIAQAVNLLNFLKGPKQFIIPMYQRTYSWTLKECGQLWDDIVKTGDNDKVSGHFVGAVPSLPQSFVTGEAGKRAWQ